MKKNISVFQKQCQKVLDTLSEEDVEKFKASKDEETRIGIIHNYAKNIPIQLLSCEKNLEDAQKEKTKGNNFFSKKDYKNANKAYNAGIVKCPQDTDEGQELLTILIANRSATFFELKEYKRVFNDIDYILEIGKYPHHLQYKIWIRKARCYDALQNERSSCEAYDQAVESLQFLKLNEEQLAAKVKEIENIKKKKPEVCNVHNELMLAESTNVFMGGKDYIAAHNNVAFEENLDLGRFARAAEDIDTGTIIVQENAHCAVLDQDHSLYNCQHCLASTIQPFACPRCAHVIFCSAACEKLANRTYHRYECSIQPVLLASGASVNCSMALRIITQKNLKFFKDKRKFLKDFLKDNGKKSIPKKRPYRSDDYDAVFFLCRNELLRKKEELVHYGCMASFLLNLLKTTDYFGNKCDPNVLTEDEQFIASLILRHLQILQFSSHEISQLQNTESTDVNQSFGNEESYKSVQIGAALYPTLALFNHSCDPSIVRYNIGSKMLVRTIKPVKAGDIIYENYGPIYTTTPKHERQEYLQEKYWFECLCAPCVDLWPLLENMNEYELRIPCKTQKCPFVFVVHKDDYCPLLECSYCKQMTSLLPFLKGLMVLQELLPRAEDLYAQADYDNALKMYISALNILFQYTRPPCPDMVKVQQRIRTCMIHFGNKALDYVPVKA